MVGLNELGNDLSPRLWRLPVSGSIAQQHLLEPHNTTLLDVSFSDDCRWLLASESTKTNLFDLTSAGLKPHHQALPGSINRPGLNARFGGNSRWLVGLRIKQRESETSSIDTEVDVDTAVPRLKGKELGLRLWRLGQLDRDQFVDLDGLAFCFSSDGKLLATSSDLANKQQNAPIHVWDLQRQAEADTLTTQGSRDARAYSITLEPHRKVMLSGFSGDKRFLLAGGEDHTMCIWDLASEEPRETLTVLRGHDSDIVKWSIVDDRWLFTSALDGSTHQWDLKKLFRVELKSEPTAPQIQNSGAIAVSRNGQWVFNAGADNAVRAFATNSSSNDTRILAKLPETVAHLAVSPNGQWLASSDITGTVRLWNINRFPEGRKLAFTGEAEGGTPLSFSPDGRFFAVNVNDHQSVLIDLTKGFDENGVPAEYNVVGMRNLAFSSDSQRVCGGSEDLGCITSLDEDFSATRLIGHASDRTAPRFDSVQSVVIDSENHYAYSAFGWEYGEVTVRRWDLQAAMRVKSRATIYEAKCVDILQGGSGVNLELSPDSRRLACGSTVWNLSADNIKKSRIQLPVDRPIHRVAFGHDGETLITVNDSQVQLWDLGVAAPEESGVVLIDGLLAGQAVLHVSAGFAAGVTDDHRLEIVPLTVEKLVEKARRIASLE